jgi:hypothetical protein
MRTTRTPLRALNQRPFSSQSSRAEGKSLTARRRHRRHFVEVETCIHAAAFEGEHVGRRKAAAAIDVGGRQFRGLAQFGGGAQGAFVNGRARDVGAEMEMNDLDCDLMSTQYVQCLGQFGAGHAELRRPLRRFRIEFLARLQAHPARPAQAAGQRRQDANFGRGIKVHPQTRSRAGREPPVLGRAVDQIFSGANPAWRAARSSSSLTISTGRPARRHQVQERGQRLCLAGEPVSHR